MIGTAIGAQSGCEHSTDELHRIVEKEAYSFRGGGYLC